MAYIKNSSNNTNNTLPRRKNVSQKSSPKAKGVSEKQSLSKGSKNPRRKYKQAKRRKNRYLIYYVFVVICLLVSLIVLSYTVFFKVKVIDIIGDTEYTVEQVVSASKLDYNASLLLVDTEAIEKSLVEYAINIDEVKVTKKLPNTITVEFVKVAPKFVIAQDAFYYEISQSGRVTGIADNVDNVLQVYGLDIVLKQGKFISDDTYKDYYTEYQQYIMEKDTDSYKRKYTAKQLEEIQIENEQKYSYYKEYEAYLTVIELIDKLETMGKISKISFDGDIKVFYDDRIWVVFGNMVDIDYKVELATVVLEENMSKSVKGELNCTVVGQTSFIEE